VPTAIADTADIDQGVERLGDRFIVGGDKTALARGHVLARLETERADVSQSSDCRPFVPSPDGLRAILDDGEAVVTADTPESLHVCRPSSEVDGNDRPGALGERRFHGVRIE